MTARESSAGARDAVADGLATVREDDVARWFATALGAAVGLLAASVDPLGIVLGGALVAIPARDPYRGVGAALGFGVLVLAVFLLRLLAAGSAGSAVAMGAPFWLAVVVALGASLLGGLVRGVV